MCGLEQRTRKRWLRSINRSFPRLLVPTSPTAVFERHPSQCSNHNICADKFANISQDGIGRRDNAVPCISCEITTLAKISNAPLGSPFTRTQVSVRRCMAITGDPLKERRLRENPLRKDQKIVSLAGSRTPLSRVTGGCTSRYTTRDHGLICRSSARNPRRVHL